MKNMTPREFRELGYLQELNRQFLHPLGLTLAITIDDDDPTKDCFGPVLDNRDDEEGWVFGDRPELKDIRRARAANIQAQLDLRKDRRIALVGSVIEPV